MAPNQHQAVASPNASTGRLPPTPAPEPQERNTPGSEMDLDDNEKIKVDIVGSLIPLPKQYDGDRNKFAEFVLQCQLFIKFNNDKFNEPDDEGDPKCFWISALLTGAAHRWVQPFLSEALASELEHWSPETQAIFGTFGGFCLAFRQNFEPLDKKVAAERELRKLRQKNSVTSYTTEFQQRSVLVSWNDEAKRSQYYEGLKGKIKDELTYYSEPRTLTEQIKLSVQLDNLIYRRKLERGQGQSKDQGESKKSKKQRKWEKRQNRKGTDDSKELAITYRKELSRKDKERYRNKKLCFNCQKEGHQARKCPKKGKEPNATRMELMATERVELTSEELETLGIVGEIE